MRLVTEDIDADIEEVDAETTSLVSPLREELLHDTRFPIAVRRTAYHFDGMGNYFTKEWNLTEGRGKEFCWYHVELPKENQKLPLYAQHLIDVLCPPLKLQDILALVSNGPFCGYVDGALVFRVNSAGPPASKFTHRLAARVTDNSVITVSLGRVPRLGFKRMEKSLLYEIPRVEKSNLTYGEGRAESSVDVMSENEFDSVTVIKEHVLEFLLTMNHSEEADNPVPRTVSNLIVHIVDTHMDQLQDIVTTLGLELDTVEIELDKGDFALRKQMMDERRFPKMHLNLQRLLQVLYSHIQVKPLLILKY
ncbi:unnamed protein product [Victoria cruziana]